MFLMILEKNTCSYLENSQRT